MICLDTDILVDCLRGLLPAAEWLKQVDMEAYFVPGIVAMELVAGARDKKSLTEMLRFLSALNIAWPGETEMQMAYVLQQQYRFAAGLSIPDCIIASMAMQRSAALCSFNNKHFGMIANLSIMQPYERG